MKKTKRVQHFYIIFHIIWKLTKTQNSGNIQCILYSTGSSNAPTPLTVFQLWIKMRLLNLEAIFLSIQNHLTPNVLYIMVYEVCVVWEEWNSNIFWQLLYVYFLYSINSHLYFHAMFKSFRHWKIKLVISVGSIQKLTVYMDKAKAWWLEFHSVVDKASFLFIKME